MPSVFNQTFQVLHSESDPWSHMTPGAVLRRVQEIATAHCESVGINAAVYEKTHSAFLLSKISLRVTRMPSLHEKVTIQSRAYAMQHAVFQRMTSIFSSTGDVLCEADSRWVLANTESRRIYRRLPQGFPDPFLDPPGAEQHDLRLPKPGALLRLADEYAGYSRCDSNQHLNNTRYADIVCDHLPLQWFEQGPRGRMVICYHSEIPLGQSFTLFGAPTAPNAFFFRGEREGKKHFETAVTVEI